jgi:hypothetical protein
MTLWLMRTESRDYEEQKLLDKGLVCMGWTTWAWMRWR